MLETLNLKIDLRSKLRDNLTYS